MSDEFKMGYFGTICRAFIFSNWFVVWPYNFKKWSRLRCNIAVKDDLSSFYIAYILEIIDCKLIKAFDDLNI